MTNEGEGVPGEDGWGRGGDGNPPTTRATKVQGAGGGDEVRMGRPRTVADIDSAGTLIRHTDGTNGARPDHGALVRHK